MTKLLLIVEDEPATLRFYSVGLKGLQDWRILTAENGQKALEVLRQEAVDVLVTDLNMPVMDGYKLITWAHERFPSLPIIVLTSMAELEPQARARALGALRVLSKPVRLSLLMEEIRLLGSREPQGLVKGLPLSSLLQLLNWERNSCTMTVRSGQRVGYLYVKDGEVIQALCGPEEGLPAAYEVLSWARPEVEFVQTCRMQPLIDLPVTELLMNAAMIQDHREESATNPDFRPDAPEPPKPEPPKPEPPILPDPWTSF